MNVKSLERLGEILDSVAQYESHNFIAFFCPLRDLVEEFLVNELKRGRLDIRARPVVDIVGDIKAHLAKFPATQMMAQQDVVFYSEFAVGRAASAQGARDTEVSFLSYIVDQSHVDDTMYFKPFGGYKDSAPWRTLLAKCRNFRLNDPVVLDALSDPPAEEDETWFDTIADFSALADSMSSDGSVRPDGLVCTPESLSDFPYTVRS